MAVTQIDLDTEALTEVMRVTGLRTKKDAVNHALREVAQREKRVAAFERARERSKNWDYEGWQELRAAEKATRRG